MTDRWTEPTSPASIRNIRFQGCRRDGVATTGCTVTADLPAWVESRWLRGWMSLAILEDEDVVARIERSASGERVWWADDGTARSAGAQADEWPPCHCGATRIRVDGECRDCAAVTAVGGAR